MSSFLQTSREGGLLRIALNRPEKRNALSVELCRELVSAMEDAERDPNVRAILLTANGPAFCAGMDLGEMFEGGTDDRDTLHEQLFTLGSRLTRPIIGAVHGAALAGGTGLAANCHIVIAAEDATFGLTEIRLGLWPFVVFRQVALAMGQRRTVELSLTGRIFGASEALSFGLVHQVVPRGELESAARATAAALAAASPAAVNGGLRFVKEIRGKSWEESGEMARRLRSDIFRGADFQEGIRAFREKRPPSWPSLG